MPYSTITRGTTKDEQATLHRDQRVMDHVGLVHHLAQRFGGMPYSRLGP